MTQGQMMFLAGVVFLLLTIVLAIIFLVKKPRYLPEQFDGTGGGSTSRFRNGYPTDRLTKRYPSESETSVQPLVLKEEPKDVQRIGESPICVEGTEGLIEQTGFEEETEPLQDLSDLLESTERLKETAGLDETTEALQETGHLAPQIHPLGEETENLNENN